MAQDNFYISQQNNFNNNQLLRRKVFSINKNKNRVIRQPKDLRNLVKAIRSCLENNYYCVSDLILIINIKREIIMSLKYYAKIYFV